MFRLRVILLSAILSILPQVAFAQLSIGSPSADTVLKPCDDFPSLVLNNPIDMSDNSDINYFIASDIGLLNGKSFSGGNFSATIGGSGAYFYLLSPKVQDSEPSGGRYGENFPIDTSKYTQFVMRMYTDTLDSGGYRLIWNRGDNYTTSRTITSFNSTKTGWNLYRLNLNGATIAGDSSNTNPWSSGSITGFAVLPHASTGAAVQVDYIRLEDTSSCGSETISYTATPSGGENYVNLYVDDDNNPLNGYHSSLVTEGSASGADTVSVSTNGLMPGNYKISGFLSGDYATVSRHDPWDFANADDILITGGVTEGVFSGGSFSGTTSSSASAIYLRLASSGIDTSKFNKLTFKLSRSSYSGLMQLFSDSGGMSIDPNVYHVGGDIYQIDLSGQSWWTGTASSLILRPAVDSGVSFSLDFLALHSQNYMSEESDLTPTIVTAPGELIVNDPPRLAIIKPDKQGGEAIRPWNMNDGDFVLYQNLRSDADPNFSGEKYSGFLPDVRTIDGLRGDFFKGTNNLGVDHSINYSTFPLYNDNPLSINADVYKHLCVKLLNDRDLDVCLGAIVRPYWLNSDSEFTTALAAVTIYDHWSDSRWYEYCFDLKAITLNYSDEEPWEGTKIGFRVDPNEYYRDTCGNDGTPTGNGTSTTYYWDYIKLRKDYAANQQFAIVYSLADSDDVATVNFYYNTTNSTSGGTLINPSAISESAATRTYLWDTSALPANTYYVYGVASDGYNTVSRLADNPVVVTHGVEPTATPVLALETPSDSMGVCDSLQVKGYALMGDRFEDVATVEVLFDGVLLSSIQPSVYSPNAKAAYPDLDSSNSGFNSTFDISGYSAGSHTVSVKAYSTDGELASIDRSISKGSSGCPSSVTDPDPQGTPVTIPGNFETTFDITKPVVSKAKISRNGTFSLTAKNLIEDAYSCRVRIEFGSNTKKFNLNTGYVDVSSSPRTFLAKKAGIPRAKKGKIYTRVTKACSNDFNQTETSTSSFKAVKAPQKGKTKSLGAFNKQVKKLMIQK